jgi:hypothetical protein
MFHKLAVAVIASAFLIGCATSDPCTGITDPRQKLVCMAENGNPYALGALREIVLMERCDNGSVAACIAISAGTLR